AAFLAASTSALVARPSANCSTTTTALRLTASVIRSQTRRRQAEANKTSFLSLAFAPRNFNIGSGSVQAFHPASVIASPPTPRHARTLPVADQTNTHTEEGFKGFHDEEIVVEMIVLFPFRIGGASPGENWFTHRPIRIRGKRTMSPVRRVS